MIGDDRVICYTGADGDTSDAEGAQATEWGLAGIRVRDISTMFSLCFEILELYRHYDLISYKFLRVFTHFKFSRFGNNKITTFEFHLYIGVF